MDAVLDLRSEERRASWLFGVDLPLCSIPDEALALAHARNPINSSTMDYGNEELEGIAGTYHALVLEDPLQLMRGIYDMCFAQYVIGTKENYNGSFPDYCCGISSMNLFVNLLRHGHNAMFAYSSEADHCYNIIPVIHAGKPGVIIADPTAQQLWKSRRPLVNVELRTGRWRYSTDWAHGSDLFPTRIITAKILAEKLRESKLMGRERTSLYGCETTGVWEHLAACYANPRKP